MIHLCLTKRNVYKARLQIPYMGVTQHICFNLVYASQNSYKLISHHYIIVADEAWFTDRLQFRYTSMVPARIVHVLLLVCKIFCTSTLLASLDPDIILNNCNANKKLG